jgi:DNA-binding NtrC family response regulator
VVESELFGHEKGSFTGAIAARAGCFERASNGTLFLDEIAEAGPDFQAKLLRVLEDGHFRRVGSTQEQNANVRVLAATNKNLEEEQTAGRFRDDLYYRLNVVPISLPPLSERRQDIPELVEHFLTNRQLGSVRYHVQPEALEALVRYGWPGNIRELANVLERAQILAEDYVITLDDLPDPRHLCEVVRQHVSSVLKQENGNKVRAAKALGISRRALYRTIAKYHLEDTHPETAAGEREPRAEDA